MTRGISPEMYQFSLADSIGCRRRFLQQRPLTPIPEPLPVLPLLRVARQDGTKFSLDIGFFHHVLEDLVEAGAGGIAAEPELVATRRFTDEADLGRVRAGAAGGAAGCADDDFLA